MKNHRVTLVTPTDKPGQFELSYAYFKDGRKFRTVRTKRIFRYMTEQDRDAKGSETITVYDPTTDFQPRKLIEIKNGR